MAANVLDSKDVGIDPLGVDEPNVNRLAEIESIAAGEHRNRSSEGCRKAAFTADLSDE
jgi:hypothetical protein